LKRLFELEVPEIYEGIVEIKAIAREAGGRSKFAVASRDKNVDAVGACVGPKGTRVQSIVDELKGEKIDIVSWNADSPLFVASALSPAKVTRVEINEETKTALVIVPDNQLSLAIGREGQNARLAAKLTGWRIDIKSEMQIKEIEAKKIFADLPEEAVAGAPAAADAPAGATTPAGAATPAAGEEAVTAGSGGVAPEGAASAEVVTAGVDEAVVGVDEAVAGVHGAAAGVDEAVAGVHGAAAEASAEEESAPSAETVQQVDDGSAPAADAGEAPKPKRPRSKKAAAAAESDG
jgi:transcription antitermination factor NusA-like protein